MEMVAHQPDYYIGGILVKDEWKGKFNCTEEQLYEHLEIDCDTDLESLIVLNMIDSLKTYQLWWDKVQNERG